MEIRNAALRICQERGIQPAESLDEPPLYRSDFYTQQLADVIHRRWDGLYDATEVDSPRVAAWLSQHLDAPREHPALLLVGKTGSGKTWQAIGVLKAIGRSYAQHGRRCDWQVITHPDLNEELRPKSDGSNEWALDKYLNADLLILDDLGSGQTTAWTTDSIQRLVDHRWTRRAATVYTTNLNGEALRDVIGDRAYSRLGDATRIGINGNDRRWHR